MSIVARFLRTKLEKILLRAEGTAGASEAHDAIYLLQAFRPKPLIFLFGDLQKS